MESSISKFRFIKFYSGNIIRVILLLLLNKNIIIIILLERRVWLKILKFYF